ncbi:MAG TPA: hypothetical protein VIJ07_11810 [Dermatophilaceae bacterium]
MDPVHTGKAFAGLLGLIAQGRFNRQSTVVFWPAKKRARIEVGKWIEDRYNRCRRHASIGQISPVDFELQYSRQIADSQKAA